ncbi:MAG: hypothetical protein RLY43_1038 [Bacteroidota bacterium]|jgi:hypothetical protein
MQILGQAVLAGAYPTIKTTEIPTPGRHIDPKYGKPMSDIPSSSPTGDGWGQAGGSTKITSDQKPGKKTPSKTRKSPDQ